MVFCTPWQCWHGILFILLLFCTVVRFFFIFCKQDAYDLYSHGLGSVHNGMGPMRRNNYHQQSGTHMF